MSAVFDAFCAFVACCILGFTIFFTLQFIEYLVKIVKYYYGRWFKDE